MPLTPHISPETEGDEPDITVVNDRAFGQKDEGRLVQKLRRTEAFLPDLSLVAEIEGRIVGHILFYPVVISTPDGDHPTLSLAPMSVLPEYQNKGIGSALVREGLRIAKDLNFTSVIVIGHPHYYPRFGFRKAGRRGLRSPFDVPEEAFMAMELVERALKDKGGIVQYPKEFEEL